MKKEFQYESPNYISSSTRDEKSGEWSFANGWAGHVIGRRKEPP